MLEQDFDRGAVPMKCDKRESGCVYGLPHYHCQICGRQVNSDELRRDYHPCCSEECIRVYNQRYYPQFINQEKGDTSMPYVPSEKTVPPAEDRKIIDAALAPLVQSVAAKITNNFSLRKIYERVFVETASYLRYMLKSPRVIGKGQTWDLAKAIFETGAKYGYEGAYLGEFNYAFTQFIQLIPQEKVKRGDWEDELRYWLYSETVTALKHAEEKTENLDIGVDGVFRDIKDEYKWEVNRSYEIAQILKSGHCYFTPYYNRVVEVVDEEGKFIGHIEVMLKRSDDTLNKDMLDFQLVLKKKS